MKIVSEIRHFCVIQPNYPENKDIKGQLWIFIPIDLQTFMTVSKSRNIDSSSERKRHK